MFFFFNDTATTEIYTLSLHDALPISPGGQHPDPTRHGVGRGADLRRIPQIAEVGRPGARSQRPLGALAQQFPNPWRVVAGGASPKPPRRGSAPKRGGSTYHPPPAALHGSDSLAYPSS